MSLPSLSPRTVQIVGELDAAEVKKKELLIAALLSGLNDWGVESINKDAEEHIRQLGRKIWKLRDEDTGKRILRHWAKGTFQTYWSRASAVCRIPVPWSISNLKNSVLAEAKKNLVKDNPQLETADQSDLDREVTYDGKTMSYAEAMTQEAKRLVGSQQEEEDGAHELRHQNNTLLPFGTGSADTAIGDQEAVARALIRYGENPRNIHVLEGGDEDAAGILSRCLSEITAWLEERREERSS